MNKIFAFILFFATGHALAHTWTSNQISEIFNTLYGQGAVVAIAEVEAYDVTPYDFGIDLLEIGDQSNAFSWFNALHQAFPDDRRFAFGKAWLLKERNEIQAAMSLANQLVSSAQTDLQSARAHYLLGVILWQGNSYQHARAEFLEARAKYAELEKIGGLSLCDVYLSPQKSKDLFDPPAPPPRDDTDS